jgi:triacylglycerol lipase
MRPVERLLSAHGFEVLNLDYPSTRATIPELAEWVVDRLSTYHPDEALDFVTHSLGGVLLRFAVAAELLPASRVHRVVMLGPPNAGSELADELPRMPVVGPVYRRITGPTGIQLGTTADALPAQLPPVPFETGIIAGTRSFNPFFSAILGGPSDGKVRVDRAGVAGMADFITVPYWHPLLMRPAAVHALILHFLEHGTFR